MNAPCFFVSLAFYSYRQLLYMLKSHSNRSGIFPRVIPKPMKKGERIVLPLFKIYPS